MSLTSASAKAVTVSNTGIWSLVMTHTNSVEDCKSHYVCVEYALTACHSRKRISYSSHSKNKYLKKNYIYNIVSIVHRSARKCRFFTTKGEKKEGDSSIIFAFKFFFSAFILFFLPIATVVHAHSIILKSDNEGTRINLQFCKRVFFIAI